MGKFVKKFSSFEEAERAEIERYRRMSMSEKFAELMQLCYPQSDSDETKPRLQRVYKIIKLS